MVDTDALVRTRLGLHAVAEHVLAAASFAARGRLGLRVVTGGFATLEYPAEAEGRPVLRRLLVVGTDLVRRDDAGDGTAQEERVGLVTVAAAAAVARVTPGLPAGLHEPATDLVPAADLGLDPVAAAHLAAVLARADAALTSFAADHPTEAPAEAQLWPEHLDLATSFGEVNYGVSLGDAGHPRPYAYVGPWSPPPADGFWNEPFGASLDLAGIPEVADLVGFFAEGRARLS